MKATPKRVKDITGLTFGRLIVQGFLYQTKSRHAVFLCECSCGTLKEILSSNLISGETNSCGCLQQEWRTTPHPTHAMSGSREYSTWKSMINRCKYKSVKSYPHYGGRGIKVCPEWESFEQFYADMGDRPDGATLERDDCDGNYEPSNCRWATHLEQGRNKRNSIKLTIDGVTKHVNDWADISGVKSATIVSRIKQYNWDAKKAVFTKTNSFHRNITFNGETLNCSDWAERCGVSKKTINNRLDKGWPVEKILKELT